MATSVSLAKKWKLKLVTAGGIWLPQRGKPDWIIFGDNSSKRLDNGKKMVIGFTGQIDNAYIYEVGEEGKLIATFKPELKRFVLDSND